MMPLVENLELEAFVHATEDPSRVRKALKNILPKEERAQIRISEIALTGHYGNPIIIMRIVLKESLAAERVLRHIALRLREEDKHRIDRTLDLRVDENGNMYMRISKQGAYLGKMMLSNSGDVIRIKAKLTRDLNPRVVCKKLGLIP